MVESLRILELLREDVESDHLLLVAHVDLFVVGVEPDVLVLEDEEASFELLLDIRGVGNILVHVLG